jgi:hypothetical protein
VLNSIIVPEAPIEAAAAAVADLNDKYSFVVNICRTPKRGENEAVWMFV